MRLTQNIFDICWEKRNEKVLQFFTSENPIKALSRCCWCCFQFQFAIAIQCVFVQMKWESLSHSICMIVLTNANRTLFLRWLMWIVCVRAYAYGVYGKHLTTMKLNSPANACKTQNVFQSEALFHQPCMCGYVFCIECAHTHWHSHTIHKRTTKRQEEELWSDFECRGEHSNGYYWTLDEMRNVHGAMLSSEKFDFSPFGEGKREVYIIWWHCESQL